ncbi:hypothetical protein R1sor_011536 [Riccia sorocarpa]|uniref:Bifunctional inhibitor/plant lipid transfer protein/seed storage helical domain-containing protein n=1 Tax=Riccia sorocarpa TaxID=122646 RepID=A0ABD3I515_9MARC
MATLRLQLLVLCILAMTVVQASAFKFPPFDKPDFNDPFWKAIRDWTHHKPGGHKKGQCAPLGYWNVCGLYIAESDFFKGPHKKWQPVADYYSLCCQLVRKESVGCICRAVTTKYPHVKIDVNRSMYLPQWCKKPVPKGTKCHGKNVYGYVPKKHRGHGGGHH